MSVEESTIPKAQGANNAKANPFILILFDPTSLFHAISSFLYPLSRLRFFIFPAAVLAAFAAVQNWYDLIAHITRITPSITVFQHLILSLFTINLTKNVMTGVTMSHFGVGPKAFGVQLFLGIFPRFYVPVKDAKHLEYRAQRICYSAPLLTQLFFFAGGILSWTALRHSGAGTADLVLVVGISAFVAFLITANPLWPAASGYRWLSAYFKRPELRKHSLRLLFLIASGEPAPSRLRSLETIGLLSYAVLMIAYNLIFSFVIISAGAILLEKEYRGSGVIIFCVLLTSMMFFIATRFPAMSLIRNSLRNRARKSERTRTSGDALKDLKKNPIAKFFTIGQNIDGAHEAHEGSNRDDAAMKSNTKQKSFFSGRLEFLSRLFEKLKKPMNPRNGRSKNPPTKDSAGKTTAGHSVAASAQADSGAEVQDIESSLGRNQDKSQRSVRSAPRQEAREPQRRVEKSKSIEELNRVLAFRSKITAAHRPWRNRLIWLGLAALLLIICLLPYPFDVGGEFTVQPAARAQVRARTNGEIIELHVEEGDWVEEGSIIATLSHWNEERDVAVREQELRKLRADLETLKYGARNEEVSLARQKIAAADIKVAAARSEFERQRRLFETNTISEKALEISDNQYRAALVAKSEAEAGLALVQSSAQESEIAAAEATIARNEVDLAFSKLNLEYTKIRATVSGQIVSSLKERPVGAFLPAGELFTEIEDNRTIIAEVEVPESEISEVKIGAEVELRPWSAGGESVTGIVSKIAPKADERDFGRVFRVSVEVPNTDGFMSVNMTGQAKISVGDWAVWRVFSRPIVRFFTVELWSWIP